MARSGAVNMDDMLSGISVPEISVPDLDSSSPLSALHTPQQKDLFAPRSRAAWKERQLTEARCDFAPNKVRISFRAKEFGIVSLWKKSLYGRTLVDIKADPEMVEYFAENVSHLIAQMLGCSLASGDWCIVTSPKRRHKEHNFASLIAARIGQFLGIPFYEDVAVCHSKHRIDAVFTLGGEAPSQRNIIVFDDFVTSGATMKSMYNLLHPLGYNLFFITGVNNKL